MYILAKLGNGVDSSNGSLKSVYLEKYTLLCFRMSSEYLFIARYL